MVLEAGHGGRLSVRINASSLEVSLKNGLYQETYQLLDTVPHCVESKKRITTIKDWFKKLYGASGKKAKWAVNKITIAALGEIKSSSVLFSHYFFGVGSLILPSSQENRCNGSVLINALLRKIAIEKCAKKGSLSAKCVQCAEKSVTMKYMKGFTIKSFLLQKKS